MTELELDKINGKVLAEALELKVRLITEEISAAMKEYVEASRVSLMAPAGMADVNQEVLVMQTIGRIAILLGGLSSLFTTECKIQLAGLRTLGETESGLINKAMEARVKAMKFLEDLGTQVNNKVAEAVGVTPQELKDKAAEVADSMGLDGKAKAPAPARNMALPPLTTAKKPSGGMVN